MRLPSFVNIFFFYLHSASGASVVAIDNKIEQAMVSFPQMKQVVTNSYSWLTFSASL